MRLAAEARRAGYRLEHHEALGSTNDRAMSLAAAGDAGRLWVVADVQTAGRGRQGRPWASPPGNLYASLLLMDAVDPAAAWQVGFAAAVALVDAVHACTGTRLPLAIKWPNDLLLGEAKLAGVLVEGTRFPDGRFALVVGCGVNCASHPPDTPYPATDLAAALAVPPGAQDVFDGLAARLPAALDGLASGFSSLREAWLARALRPGTRMTVSARGARLAGSFRTIDDGGRLVLDTAEGLVRLDVGDVLAAEAPAPAG